MNSRSVCVTGVSTGIGRGIARVLLQAGLAVFGSVRREADAERLRAELGANFTPLLFDVTDEPAIKRAASQVAERLGNGKLSGLVNNAGIAVVGPLAHLDARRFREQLEINLVGQLLVTQAFLPLLGADRSRTGAPGRIVNMSSVGGKIGAPFLGAYAASKHGLEGFSECLRRELMLYGIDVIIVGPGAVKSAIWQKSQQGVLEDFGNTPYRESLEVFRDFAMREGATGFDPEKVGQTVLEALTAARPKTRYAVVPSPLTRWIIPRLLPRRVIDRAIGRVFKLLAKT
jgi:NAD(P)-dependent dehydrogenase (short-subunit alcohol dehydrogenase family)